MIKREDFSSFFVQNRCTYKLAFRLIMHREDLRKTLKRFLAQGARMHMQLRLICA